MEGTGTGTCERLGELCDQIAHVLELTGLPTSPRTVVDAIYGIQLIRRARGIPVDDPMTVQAALWLFAPTRVR